MPERQKLADQKEFRRIKNIVIEEAILLSQHPRCPTPASTNLASTHLLAQSASRLLRQLGNIFHSAELPSNTKVYVQVDSKLKQKLREMKFAQGHNINEREENITL